MREQVIAFLSGLFMLAAYCCCCCCTLLSFACVSLCRRGEEPKRTHFEQHENGSILYPVQMIAMPKGDKMTEGWAPLQETDNIFSRESLMHSIQVILKKCSEEDREPSHQEIEQLKELKIML